jgi:DNA-binding MarR family transcriptional regulator
VERLVKAGYANRFTSPTDRRIVHVAITNEGLVKMTELKQSFVKKMSRSFEAVPESDMQQLLRIQQLLIDILQTQ